MDSAVDLVWCQNANGGSPGGRNPGTPRNGKRPLAAPFLRGVEKTTWKVTDNCDEEWRAGEFWNKEKRKNSLGRTQGPVKKTAREGTLVLVSAEVQEKQKEEKWKE